MPVNKESSHKRPAISSSSARPSTKLPLPSSEAHTADEQLSYKRDFDRLSRVVALYLYMQEYERITPARRKALAKHLGITEKLLQRDETLIATPELWKQIQGVYAWLADDPAEKNTSEPTDF